MVPHPMVLTHQNPKAQAAPPHIWFPLSIPSHPLVSPCFYLRIQPAPFLNSTFSRHGPSLRDIRTETQGEIMEGCCLLARSVAQAWLAFLYS